MHYKTMTTIEELKNEVKALKKEIEEYEAIMVENNEVDNYIMRIIGTRAYSADAKYYEDIMGALWRFGKMVDGKWTKEEE